MKKVCFFIFVSMFFLSCYKKYEVRKMYFDSEKYLCIKKAIQKNIGFFKDSEVISYGLTKKDFYIEAAKKYRINNDETFDDLDDNEQKDFLNDLYFDISDFAGDWYGVEPHIGIGNYTTSGVNNDIFKCDGDFYSNICRKTIYYYASECIYNNDTYICYVLLNTNN